MVCFEVFTRGTNWLSMQRDTIQCTTMEMDGRYSINALDKDCNQDRANRQDAKTIFMCYEARQYGPDGPRHRNAAVTKPPLRLSGAAMTEKGIILSNIVRSQDSTSMRPYGGVVPEIAARAHVEVLDRALTARWTKRTSTWGGWMASRPPRGPGLIGGLLAGLVMAKAVALVHRAAARCGQSPRRACADGWPDRGARSRPIWSSARLRRAFRNS